MDEKDKPYTLLAPGPVAIPPVAYDELSQPMIHHRTPLFGQILERVLKQLQNVFQTTQPVMILTSTGSGAMEAALTNVLSPGDSILIISSGKFGQRWGDIARAFGFATTVVEVPWGETVDIATIKKLLQSKNFKAVSCQACETSTGVLHPIRELAELTKDTETLMIVDAITALGAVDLPMDKWGLDVVVGGSQKAFMIPTGLGFISLSEKAWAAAAKATTPKYYFDLLPEKKANEKNQTRFSSAVSHIRALDKVLQSMADENLKALIDLVSLRADATRQGGKVLNLETFAQSPAPSLTVFKVPEGIDGAKLRTHIEDHYNVTLMGGQEGLKGKIIRIGHIGYLTTKDVGRGIWALGSALKDLGFELSDEQITDAVAKTESVMETGL